MTIPTKRLDGLDPTINPQRDHEVAAMRDGISNRLRVEQILALLQSSDIPDAAVTLTKLAADARAAGNVTFDDTDAQLGETDVQKAIEAAKVLIDEIDTLEIASTAEAQAGTDNTKAITPLRMREGFNAAGAPPVFACRAWVNFDGTLSSDGIRQSGNISSVVRDSTGSYSVNFITNMPDADYCVAIGGSRETTSPGHRESGFQSTNTFRLITGESSGGTRQNHPLVCAAVFR